MQHDQRGHQLKILGLVVCGGLEGYTTNNPVFRVNEEILPMKAQSKSLIGFMNRHNRPANAVQNNVADVAAMLLGINAPQYNTQHAPPIHQYNNQNIYFGCEDTTYVRAIGGYVQHLVNPNVIFKSVKAE